MIEILPLKLLREEDAAIFGSLNVSLARLLRAGFVPHGVVVAPPILKLQTSLSKYDLGHKELFEQSLILAKKEIAQIPVPEELEKELKKASEFLVNGKKAKSIKEVWLHLLSEWMEEIKQRLWKSGFSPDLTKELESIAVFFVSIIDSSGSAFFDEYEKEIKIEIEHGKLSIEQCKELGNLIKKANKFLIIPHGYKWIYEKNKSSLEAKIVGISPHVIQEPPIVAKKENFEFVNLPVKERRKTVTKVFCDFSAGSIIPEELDGAFIASEKVLDLNNKETFEDLSIRIMEVARSFAEVPLLVKLPDIPEKIAGVRGSLRLLHQANLFKTICQSITDIRNKKAITNVNIVIPFVRAPFEFMNMKRELATHKITRKHSLQLWLEIAVAENLLNIEDYIEAGIDGVVLNLDELMSSINGFDYRDEEMSVYKKEVKGLLKFLDAGMRILHSKKIPVLVYGNLISDTGLLESLIENGLFGVIIERYELDSINDLLYQIERKIVLKRTNQVRNLIN